MELNQPAFTIPSQPSKQASPFSCNRRPGGPGHRTRWNVVLGLHIFKNLVEKKNMAAVNISKFK